MEAERSVGEVGDQGTRSRDSKVMRSLTTSRCSDQALRGVTEMGPL